MPHLTLVEKASGKSHRVEGSEAFVGRDPACAVFLDGDEAKTVSGRHARFVLDDAGWHVEDAGSRNGTYVGSRKLEPGTRHLLSAGDIIGLGLTGTQLGVKESVGRLVAATIVESAAALQMPAGHRAEPSGQDLRLILRPESGAGNSVGQGDRITIGRALECLIRVEGEGATSVSRVHAEVSVIDGKISIRDGGSRHGTFLNGSKIDSANPLKAGDVLMLGPGGPTFTVEEVRLVSAGSPPPAQPTSSSAAVDDSETPTDVRAAAKAAAAASSYEAVDPRRSTPGLDQPAFLRSAKSSAAPATSAVPPIGKGGPPRRLNAALVAGVVLAVATAAVVAIARPRAGRGDGGAAGSVTQQAAELEAIKTAAVNDAVKAKAALDSATSAAAPASVIDSLRLVLAEADRRVTDAEQSLRRVR